jgi:biopolymer transport protein ExbD/biopolymer transport protein TolR
MLAQHTRSVKLFCQIDTSAFASIVAVILYLMMVTDPLLHPPHHGVSVDLPKVSHPVLMARANREDALTVWIMRDGTVYFGGDRVLPQHLSSKILDRLKDRTVERRVYIRADAHTWYGPIKEALDEVRSA